MLAAARGGSLVALEKGAFLRVLESVRGGSIFVPQHDIALMALPAADRPPEDVQRLAVFLAVSAGPSLVSLPLFNQNKNYYRHYNPL